MTVSFKKPDLLKQHLVSFFELDNFCKDKSSDFEFSPHLQHLDLKFRPAAVLISITYDKGEPKVVFTRRAKNLKQHPGQIAFPGGKVDQTDSSEMETAIRECFEEISLSPSDIDMLGMLPRHNTVTGYCISPFVAIIKNYEKLKPDSSEVSEIFKVPLEFLLEKKNMQLQSWVYSGHIRSYYAITYGPYYIWGATARIIKTFADLIG